MPKTKPQVKLKIGSKLFLVLTIIIVIALVATANLTIFNKPISNIGNSYASATESADINSDNKVDIVDLSILLSKWSSSDSTSDLNSDGTVNIIDLSILLSAWGDVDTGTSSCPKSTPHVPDGPDGSGGCWPGPSNTGIAGCPALTTHNGNYYASSNSVIENKLIKGQLLMTSGGLNNVTVRCVKVEFGETYFPIDTERSGSDDATQIIFDRVEVDCKGSQQPHAGMLLFGATVKNSRVYNCADAFRFVEDVVIENSYCSDLNVIGDSNNDWHYDCSQTSGGYNIVIKHNSFVGRDTSDIAIWPDITPINNVLVENNLLIGTPGYKIYVGKGFRSTTNVTVKDNWFGDGGYGPCSVVNSSPMWTNNRYIRDGTQVPLSICG